MTTELLTIATITAKALGTILLTDLASGVVHWLEDSYGKATWPILGKHVIQPNIDHHFFPRRFTKNHWLYRNSSTIAISAGIGVVLTLLSAWSPYWLLALVIGAFANEIHCWAHQSPKENGKLISRLQKIGVVQSPRHHGKHHTDPKNRTYCTITNYVNPALDSLRVFQRAEAALERVFGVKRRVDESVKPDHERIGKKNATTKTKKCCGKDCDACRRCPKIAA